MSNPTDPSVDKYDDPLHFPFLDLKLAYNFHYHPILQSYSLVLDSLGQMMIIFFVKNVSSSGVYLKPLYSPVDHTRYINGSTVFFTFIFIGWLLCMVLYCRRQPPLVQPLFHRRAGSGLFLAKVSPQTADFVILSTKCAPFTLELRVPCYANVPNQVDVQHRQDVVKPHIHLVWYET